MFEGKVAEKLELSEEVVLTHIELIEPHRIEFNAGQYVEIDVSGEGEWVRCHIASMPEMDHAIELVNNVKVDGGRADFFRRLSPGDLVHFRGPEGELKVPLSKEKLIFAVESMGIVPIRSILIDLLEKRKDTREVVLHWGLEMVDGVFWEEELHQIDEEYANFSLDIVLERPILPEWKLCSGKVVDCLTGHYGKDTGSRYVICGGEAMIEEVESLLEVWGVEKERIIREVMDK